MSVVSDEAISRFQRIPPLIKGREAFGYNDNDYLILIHYDHDRPALEWRVQWRRRKGGQMKELPNGFSRSKAAMIAGIKAIEADRSKK